MKVKISGSATVVEQLQQAGVELDLRCGGRGICGRCNVAVIAGDFLCDNSPVSVGETVPACRLTLLGDVGELEIPESSLRKFTGGQLADDWSSRSLPDSKRTVIAVDLGTTTLAAVKLCGNQIVKRCGTFNLQSQYGDNVLSRIDAAANNLSGLQQAAADSINLLLQQLGTDDVECIAVSGNTVMSSLLHKVDPAPIGVMPFVPPMRKFPVCSCASLGLNVVPDVPLYTVPAIAGYVGGDLTAGLGEVDLQPGEMLIDIGTNCEIIFHTGKELVCTAAAAGPAFEGAGIQCGCRAVAGAIDRYWGKEKFSVLGDVTEPIGLCGSALIDFLAEERKSERLSEFGRFEPAAPAMTITGKIQITEGEIEQLLKAKAAVWAGIAALEANCGVRAEKIYLAGGFAKYLSLDNAIAIGMLPERDYRILGNSSLAGAARLALSPESLPMLEHLADLPREVILNTLPEFQDFYIDGLLLP